MGEAGSDNERVVMKDEQRRKSAPTLFGIAMRITLPAQHALIYFLPCNSSLGAPTVVPTAVTTIPSRKYLPDGPLTRVEVVTPVPTGHTILYDIVTVSICEAALALDPFQA